jgi:serine/threonine protein kinase/CheY-like chemotaxis protein
MRIVAADDDALVVRVLERCLKSWGYEPVVAHDGQEAWDIMKHEDSARVVILDWDMPGLSGVDVCRLLRATPHGRNVYVLMLTGRQERDDIVEALESGADDFLAKPFYPRELQLRLAKGVRDAARASRDRPRTSDSPPAGMTLDHKYRLEKLMAKGGMGSVWLGVHLSLGVNVAIKFMHPTLARTTDFSSFDREARATAQLRNEHIVRIYDHGFDRVGLPYLVMEYLAGESLGARFTRRGALPPQDVAAVGEQTARALTEAHARGIVHRDIKPENIILEDDPERPCGFCVKLIDFGLADPTGPKNGARGFFAGTPNYLSPEYLGGGVAPNAMLDLWALAVTLFHAATGHPAFDGDSVKEVYRRLCDEPYPIPSTLNPALGAAFDAWFARACNRNPAERFQTASALAYGLAAACRESSQPSSGVFVGASVRNNAATQPELRSPATAPPEAGQADLGEGCETG